VVREIVTKGLSEWSLEILHERARLAIEDPAGEADAVAPLDYEQAWYNLIAADGELAEREASRPIFSGDGDPGIAEALGIPWSGKGYCRCPAHGDTRPTLSWKWDRRLMLYCFAGCTYDEIVGALRS
jgi:hypothetical protein